MGSDKSNRGIVTVLGKDQIGIIAWVSGKLAENKVNILDISQTILQDFFTMIMVVDLSTSVIEMGELAVILRTDGQAQGLQVNIQHEDVFTYMHRV